MAKCTGVNCPMQVEKVDPKNCSAVENCQWATKTVTNADKIRTMTDEELSRFLGKYGTCPPNKDDIECRLLGCSHCWERWLKEEAKNDG